jgi:hypothetical protein
MIRKCGTIVQDWLQGYKNFALVSSLYFSRFSSIYLEVQFSAIGAKSKTPETLLVCH